ncbi:hypothetical protein GUI12_02140 [Anaplasmataceae bacterium AB001_6]|nr:hypothetical protein GUI12_02140 [Anaplasmataceae bacterium AB001_6]
MHKEIIYSHAKINLFLHILGKDPNGYHLLESVVCFLQDLYDEIIVAEEKSLQRVIFDINNLNDGKDTVSKVLDHLDSLLGFRIDVKIQIKKKIPIGSGMAGGSTNAARILRFFAKKYKIKDQDVYEIAASIGADIACCINEKTVGFSGIGTILHSVITDFKNFYVISVYPNIMISSASAYKKLKFDSANSSAKIDFSNNFSMEDLRLYKNDLQECVARDNKLISDLLGYLEKMDKIIFSRMTGSGSSCFVVFANYKDAVNAHRLIQKKFPDFKIFISGIL